MPSFLNGLPGGLRLSPDAAVADRADKPKFCKSCGQSVVGHRRYRDGDGYLCHDCHKLDKNRRVPCGECGKPTKPEAMHRWGTLSICRKCYMDHQADPLANVNRKVSTRHFDKHQKRQLAILGGILLVVLIILLAL